MLVLAALGAIGAAVAICFTGNFWIDPLVAEPTALRSSDSLASDSTQNRPHSGEQVSDYVPDMRTKNLAGGKPLPRKPRINERSP